MSQTTESLRAQFEALHAHRVATMEPAYLQANVDQRRELVETANRSAFIKAGDFVGSFSLAEVDNGAVTLDDLIKTGPAVLVFFRFAGCPACNIALPYYERRLAPGLRALGASLVAISPQVPERLVEIKRRHNLSYLVASDTGNELARRFGIVFTTNANSRRVALSKGTDLSLITGTGTWELPMPAVVVIDRQRVVRYADVSPDWLIRTEAEPVLAAVEAISIDIAA